MMCSRMTVSPTARQQLMGEIQIALQALKAVGAEFELGVNGWCGGRNRTPALHVLVRPARCLPWRVFMPLSSVLRAATFSQDDWPGR